MKNFIYMAAIACLALFTSCEKQGVDHTGDQTGKLYGRWVLETKHVVTESTTEGETSTDTKDTDYSNDHFFMGIGEFPFPHAMVKEGSLLTFDIDHVDGTKITYNSELKKISFLETLYLLRGTHSLRLHGTYDVVEPNPFQQYSLARRGESLPAPLPYCPYGRRGGLSRGTGRNTCR